jgi:hypothetical protein
MLTDSAPTSSAMISRMLGRSGPVLLPPPFPSLSHSTKVISVVAEVVLSPSEMVNLTVAVPGLVLVSVVLGAIGFSTTPSLVDQ